MLYKLKLLVLRCIFAVWRLLPDRYRVGAYIWLRNHYSRLYPSGPSSAQCIPYGFYIKRTRRGMTETSSLIALNRHDPRLPVPFPLDAVEYQPPGKDWKHTYMVTSTMPGTLLRDVIEDWGEAQRDSFAKELRTVMDLVRSLPRPAGCTNTVCALDNGPILDYRIDNIKAGSWATVRAFHDYIKGRTRWDHGHVRTDPQILEFHDTFNENRVCFTHADLGPQNILQINGRLTGIVDWECAGFYPDYWEYSRSFWPYSFKEGAFEALMQVTFSEFEVEEKLERRLASASYD
jgi:Phosphotransferase enzyme family